tara:strand:- start:390 stop:494 length:105 start_codon:yes stop_codon:yes gene_type:complete
MQTVLAVPAALSRPVFDVCAMNLWLSSTPKPLID